MEHGRYIRDNRRKKRGRKILATAAFLLTVSAIAAVICLAMFFNITDISVAGLLEYTPEEVIAITGIKKGQNIFAVDDKAVTQAIHSAFPYVDTVKVVRLLPTTVELVITETKAELVMVNSPASYTLIGGNGRVLRQRTDVSTEGLPIFIGADISSLPEGQTISQKELEKASAAAGADKSLEPFCNTMLKAVGSLNTAQYLLSAAKETEFDKVSYYDVGDNLSVSLLYDNRVLVELGSELELDYKMQFGKKVLGELGESFCGTVNLSTAGNNQRSYAREQDIKPLMNTIYLEGYY
ncbi:MAG: FtsQ-type POTRA domain-containing protein [Angelakisella sp.]